MLTPVSLGGFGMVSIRELGESLDLRSYGRLQVTRHPFLSQVRTLINVQDPFNVSITAPVDGKIRMSLALLNSRRKIVLTWPIPMLMQNVMFINLMSNLKIVNILSAAGRQSIQYFTIHRRVPSPKLMQLTANEFQSIARFVRYPELRRVISELLANPVGIGPINADAEKFFPTSKGTLVNVATLSSKDFRRSKGDIEGEIICIYKIGLIMDPGEVKSWTKKLNKLTSTRHRNILLRLVHGDIYSNSRLFRFGLATDPKCLNCPEPSESIVHRVSSCPEAMKAWRELECAKADIGLTSLSDFSIENLVGAKDNLSKIELTLQAELLHRLTSLNKISCPNRLVKAVIKFIGLSEKLEPDLKAKFDSYLAS